MTIICKETQFENEKIYYNMIYEYAYSGENGKTANPFYGSQNISHGDYIYKNIMSKLIVDATKDEIFLMLIDNNINHIISHENSKINYDKLSLLINEFLNSKKMDLKKYQKSM